MASQYQFSSTSIILDVVNNVFIPTDPANASYQEVIQYVSLGGTIDPAPAPSPPGSTPQRLAYNQAVQAMSLGNQSDAINAILQVLDILIG